MQLDAARRQIVVRSAAWAVVGRPRSSGSVRLTVRLSSSDWQAWAALLQHVVQLASEDT